METTNSDKLEFRNVKGTYDYLPKEQVLRNHIIQTLKEVFEAYGYLPVETPIVSHYDILASKYGGGAEILKEVYKFKDQGQRDLALRYDLTIPTARLVAMNQNLLFPFKRYEIGKVYRDGPVKLGRNREFYQCDVDAIGVKSVMIEAELIALTLSAFKKLGIDVRMVYNNRKLMTGLIREVGVSEEKAKDVITIIDKMKKISKKEFESELKDISLNQNQIDNLQTYFSMSFDEIKKVFENSSNNDAINGINEIVELQGFLTELNILSEVDLDFTLARGHEIYTGTVFEVFTIDKTITSSFGGGGRYDDIITKFIDNGQEYPACGMSFGLEVIYTYLNLKGVEENKSLVDLYIVPMGTQEKSLMLANKIREHGVKVDIAFTNRSVSKEINKANKLNIPFVMVVGEQEIVDKKVQLKNMQESKSTAFSIDDIESIVAEIKNHNKNI